MRLFGRKSKDNVKQQRQQRPTSPSSASSSARATPATTRPRQPQREGSSSSATGCQPTLSPPLASRAKCAIAAQLGVGSPSTDSLLAPPADPPPRIFAMFARSPSFSSDSSTSQSATLPAMSSNGDRRCESAILSPSASSGRLQDKAPPSTGNSVADSSSAAHQTTSSAVPSAPKETTMTVAARPRRRKAEDGGPSGGRLPARAALPVILPRPPTPPMPSPPKVIHGLPLPAPPCRPPPVSSASSSSSQRSTSEPASAGGPYSSLALPSKSSSSPPLDAPVAWKRAHDAVVSRGRSPADGPGSPPHAPFSSSPIISPDASSLGDVLLPGPLPRKKWSPLAAFGAGVGALTSQDAVASLADSAGPTATPLPSSFSPQTSMTDLAREDRNLPHIPSSDERRDSFDEAGKAVTLRARLPKPRNGSLAPPSSTHLEGTNRRPPSERPLSIASSGATTIKADTTPRQSMAGGLNFGLAYYATGRPESTFRAYDGPSQSSSTGLWSTLSRTNDPHHRPSAPVLPTNGNARRVSIKPWADAALSGAASSLEASSAALLASPYDPSPEMLDAQASETSLGRPPSATPPMSPYLRPLASPASQIISIEEPRADDGAPLKESKTSRIISRLTHLAKSAGRSTEDLSAVGKLRKESSGSLRFGSLHRQDSFDRASSPFHARSRSSSLSSSIFSLLDDNDDEETESNLLEPASGMGGRGQVNRLSYLPTVAAPAPPFKLRDLLPKRPDVLANPLVLGPLLTHLDYADWVALNNSASEIRCLPERDELVKEAILQRYLGQVGYRSWRPEWGAEPIHLTLADLHAFLLAKRFSEESFSLRAQATVAEGGDEAPSTFAAICRSCTRVLLRLRAQVTAKDAGPGSAGQQVLKSPHRAARLRCFVPNPGSAWLSDGCIVQCETELRIASIWTHLQLGDVVWNAAVKDSRSNAGCLVWDGHYLIDLDYTYSMIGEIPPYFDGFAFAPAHWHKVVLAESAPLVHLDISGPLGSELLAGSKLIQHTSIGSDERKQSVWMYRFEAAIAHAQTQADWAGRLVILSLASEESLLELSQRCEEPGRTPFRLLRDMSRPGEIWLRPVLAEESLSTRQQ